MLNKNTLYLLLISLTKIFADECTVTNFENVAKATKICQNINIVNLTVPGGQTLKLNLLDGASVTFKGRTTFEYYSWKGPLVTINGTGVNIQGEEGHIFDGQGEKYWDGLGDGGVPKPQFFTVQTFGSSMDNIYVLNSPHDVLQVTNSDHVSYSSWYINNTAGDKGAAPEGKFAKNTDGFDIWNSTNVLIENSIVYNQDDCVAIRSGSNISISNNECHGSHGLSISVGFSNESSRKNPLNTVSNVEFSFNKLYGGRNAIHIKTHNEGGYGLIENVLYETIAFTDIENYGILIEQNYPNHGKPLDNIPIKNLQLKEIYGGLNADAVGVSIVCAENGCADWLWEDVELTGSSKKNSCNYKPAGSSVCDE